MGKADGTPDEEVGQTRKSQEPGENGALVSCNTDVCQDAKGQLEEDTPDGAAFLVDVGQHLGHHTTLCHCLQSASRTIGARVGNTDDGDGDNGVEDMREDLDTGILNGQDEGRESGVRARGFCKTLVIEGQNETKNQQVDYIEEQDAPEHLFGSLRNSLAGVGRLGGSKTTQLSTCEGESSTGKHAGKAVEAVVESTRVAPVFSTNVTLASNTTTVVDDTEEDETSTGSDLDQGEDKFDFTITLNTKELDDGEDDKEHGDPDGNADICSPEANCQRCGSELKGQDSEPRECIVQTHGKTPRRIDEADDVSVECTIDRVQDGHLSQGVHSEQKHYTDDEVADDLVHEELACGGL